MNTLQLVVTHETVEGRHPHDVNPYDTPFEISALLDKRHSFRLITAIRASPYTWRVTDHFTHRTWHLRRRYKEDAVAACLFFATRTWNNEQPQHNRIRF